MKVVVVVVEVVVINIIVFVVVWWLGLLVVVEGLVIEVVVHGNALISKGASTGRLAEVVRWVLASKVRRESTLPASFSSAALLRIFAEPASDAFVVCWLRWMSWDGWVGMDELGWMGWDG